MNHQKTTAVPPGTELDASNPAPFGFRLVSRLETGTWAESFLLEEARTEEIVVLKRPFLNIARSWPAQVNRLPGFVQSMKQMSHPRLLGVVDQGRHDGRPFLLLPHCQAGNLWKRMAMGPNGELIARPPENLQVWLPGIAAALDFLHTRGYLHGDVKPSNILFDQAGEAFLADAGLKRSLFGQGQSAAALSPRDIHGACRYLAPESICEQKFHSRSDQFSLAMIVWEWLTGRSFFKTENVTDIKKVHGILKFLPRWLTEGPLHVFRRALSKKPEERFASCGEFVNELFARLGGPILPARTQDDDNNFELYLPEEESSYA